VNFLRLDSVEIAMLKPECFTLRTCVIVFIAHMFFDNLPVLQKQAVPPTPTRKAPPSTLLIAAPVRPTALQEALTPHKTGTATRLGTAASDAQCMSQGRLPAAANPNTTTTSMHSITATVARATPELGAAVDLVADTAGGLTTAVAVAAAVARAAAVRIRRIARALAATEGRSRLLSCWSVRESKIYFEVLFIINGRVWRRYTHVPQVYQWGNTTAACV
jgi:hypothetical protein